MKKKVFIILSIMVIVIGVFFTFYLVYKQNEKKKQKAEIERIQSEQIKVGLISKKIIRISDLTVGLPKDSQEYFNKKALSISMSMLLPLDTILIQLSELEIYVKSLRSKSISKESLKFVK
jgi:hypothetical protein